MSYGDAGGGSDYGGGDYDYGSYGNTGDDNVGDNYDMPVNTRSMEEIKKDENFEAIRRYLSKTSEILRQYEVNKYAVKAQPYNDEIFQIDRRIPYLRDLAKSDEFIKRKTYENELKRVNKAISELRERREWLVSAEQHIMVEKINSINLIEFYVNRRFRFCIEDNEEYQPGYDPREDPELQKRLKDAAEYNKMKGIMDLKETEFENLHLQINNLIRDYGLRDVQDKVRPMLHPQSWTYLN